jgi:hypothetical protein
MPWAAMDLLLQAIRQNSRTVHIEQWLLLLLRTLALALFAVAVARPFMNGSSDRTQALSGPPKLWLIVLDASYSMNYSLQDQTLWSTARQRAMDLVAQADAGDAFLCFQLAEPSTAIIAQPAFDSQRVQESLAQVSCTDGGGDLASCLDLIAQALEDARQATPELTDIRLHVFTDMGADTWQALMSDPARRAWQELANRASIQIESLAPTTVANVAVMNLEAEPSLILPGRTVQLSAQISNFGAQPQSRFPVQFQSNGKTVRTVFIDLAPHQSQIVQAEIQPPQAGLWHVGIAIPDDPLTLDNQRQMILAIQTQLHVVTVEENSSGPSTGHARLINLSLAPHSSGSGLKPTGETASVRVETWSPGELVAKDWDGIDVFVLCDLPRLDSNAISRLMKFVESGGALMATLGPQTQPAIWNLPATGMSHLFGFELAQTSGPGDWQIDPLQYSSPIAKPFANFLDAGLLTTPVFQYWKIVSRPGATIERDLAFTTGDPWLVRQQLGQGWAAALLSAPMSGADSQTGQAWNAMATWPSFVPLMQRSIETIVERSERTLNVLTGQALRGTVSNVGQAREFTIQRPDSSRNHFTLPPATDGRAQPWSYTFTDRVGLYQVDCGDALEQTFAVNLFPNQSDMQAIPVTSLPSVADAPRQKAQANGPAAASPVRASERLSVWLLVAVLCVMAAESVLAWSLGRRFA